MKKVFLSVLVVALVSFGLQSFSPTLSAVDPVGTWTYKAPTAPEGYGSGDIVIALDKEAYSASLKFGDYIVKGTGVKYLNDVLTFNVYLEGEYITIKATFTADGLKGSASYSEGDILFTGKKKVVKK